MENNTINIMTSCDMGLAHLLPVPIHAIGRQVSERPVAFYLLHNGINEQTIETLERQCRCYSHLEFHAMQVSEEDDKVFSKISKWGGGWTGTAYYSLMAHQYLPDDVKKVLYLDAADTLVVGSLDEFYDTDMAGAEIMVTGVRYKKMPDGKLTLFTQADLQHPNVLMLALRGFFNSGAYLLDLQAQRTAERSLTDYLSYAERLADAYTKLRSELGDKTVLSFLGENPYFGDQGFFSAIFCGKIKYFGAERTTWNGYMPYNFCFWYFTDAKIPIPNYKPHILHIAMPFKPWLMRYLNPVPRFQPQAEKHALSELKPGQAEYYYIWHEYAMSADKLLTGIGL